MLVEVDWTERGGEVRGEGRGGERTRGGSSDRDIGGGGRRLGRGGY